jgi:hypothetical protein
VRAILALLLGATPIRGLFGACDVAAAASLHVARRSRLPQQHERERPDGQARPPCLTNIPYHSLNKSATVQLAQHPSLSSRIFRFALNPTFTTIIILLLRHHPPPLPHPTRCSSSILHTSPEASTGQVSRPTYLPFFMLTWLRRISAALLRSEPASWASAWARRRNGKDL